MIPILPGGKSSLIDATELMLTTMSGFRLLTAITFALCSIMWGGFLFSPTEWCLSTTATIPSGKLDIVTGTSPHSVSTLTIVFSLGGEISCDKLLMPVPHSTAMRDIVLLHYSRNEVGLLTGNWLTCFLEYYFKFCYSHTFVVYSFI